VERDLQKRTTSIVAYQVCPFLSCEVLIPDRHKPPVRIHTKNNGFIRLQTLFVIKRSSNLTVSFMLFPAPSSGIGFCVHSYAHAHAHARVHGHEHEHGHGRGHGHRHARASEHARVRARA